MILFDLLKEFSSDEDYEDVTSSKLLTFGEVTFLVRHITNPSYFNYHFLRLCPNIDFNSSLSFRIHDDIIILDKNRSMLFGILVIRLISLIYLIY